MANPGSGDRHSHGSQGGMEGISELLRCYICMERLTDATICPQCSKLGCFNCITRWITKNRPNCPHCRVALTVRDLIKIPLFDDLGQYLDTLRTTKKAGSNSPTGERERCPKHKEKMTVYCESCKMCICHMCALFGGEHNEHKFKPLDELYKGVVDKLEAELHHLKERMKEVLNSVQIIEKKMDAVKVTKSKTKREMQHTVEKLCGRLDDQAKEKLAMLNEQRRHLKKQALEIATQSHELEKIMVEGNVASLVGPDGQLKAEVQDMLQRLQSKSFQLGSLPSSSDFINEIIPIYDSGLFKIHPFRELQRRGEELYSKPLKVHGLTWRLKVYPNGHREDYGNYLAVFVELYDGFDRTTRYQYSIEMLYNCGNKHPHKNYKREYASEFANGECWGYKKYYELSRLEEEGFLKENTLILRFSVRAPTYYHKCRDLTDYLEKVELDKEKLKKELDSAKEQVAKLKQSIQASTSHTSPSHSASSHHISSRRSHSQSQHLHDPPQLRHSHEKQSSDEIRRYYHHSASQQPLRSHSHHTSPKRTFIQSTGHSDSRLMAEHHYPPPPGVVMVERRRSREEHEGAGGGRYIDQRRKSADPALLVNYDPTAPPPFRGSGASASAYNMTTPGEMSGNKEKRSSRLPFDDPGSDEGSSQSCDITNPTSITFTLEETTEDIKSASSSSTLVENSSGSPPRHQLQPDITIHKSPREQQLSQETFTEDDRQNLMIVLSPLCEGVPLASQPHYYQDPSFNQAPPYVGGLSQPSPPKSRHGKSLTDISTATAVAPVTMGGNSNLLALQRQFLSQSVDLPHLTQQGTGQRYTTDSLPRRARLVTQQQQQQQQGHGMKHTQSVPHSQMYRMASDSHLNYDGPPGQKMSVAGALARVKEEIEQRKPQQQGRQRGGQNHTRKQFRSHVLQKRHVQATVVSPQTNRPNLRTSSLEKSSPRHRPERSPSATVRSSQKPSTGTSSSTGSSPSSSSRMADKPTKRSIPLSNTATGDLVFQGKSKSTSSLNLELL